MGVGVCAPAPGKHQQKHQKHRPANQAPRAAAASPRSVGTHTASGIAERAARPASQATRGVGRADEPASAKSRGASNPARQQSSSVGCWAAGLICVAVLIRRAGRCASQGRRGRQPISPPSTPVVPCRVTGLSSPQRFPQRLNWTSASRRLWGRKEPAVGASPLPSSHRSAGRVASSSASYPSLDILLAPCSEPSKLRRRVCPSELSPQLTAPPPPLLPLTATRVRGTPVHRC